MVSPPHRLPLGSVPLGTLMSIVMSLFLMTSSPLILTLDTSGDQIQAGDTELTLILSLARSRAMFLVRMFTAPLLAE